MPIEVLCPYDRGKLRIPESSIGLSVRCPGCGGEFEIPLSKAATPEDQRAALARSWNALLDASGVGRAKRNETFVQLIAAYSEPHRHYHTLMHIASMLDHLPLLRPPVCDSAANVSLKLAAWYHDVVYDPRRSDNEACSAEVARLALRELGIGESTIERTCQLIRLTKEHQASDDDADALRFLDADLSILQALPHHYASYAQAIRREYAWVSDRDYCEGRKRVLGSFLNRSRIFRSTMFGDNDEARARTNIAGEIAQIDEKRRMLPS